MLAKLDDGYEMVVGARQVDTHASLGRRLANHGSGFFLAYDLLESC
jgi:hypothetical protein